MDEAKLADIEQTNNYLKAVRGRELFIAFFDDRLRASRESALKSLTKHVGAEKVGDMPEKAQARGYTLSAFRVPRIISDEWPFSTFPNVAYCRDGEHVWVEDPIVQNGKKLSEVRHPGWTCRRCRMYITAVANPTESERRVIGDVKPSARGAQCKPFSQ